MTDAGTTSSFGEDGRRLSYGGYLELDELLDLQRGLTGEHDELLFIVVHQVYELWFKQLLHELEAARAAIDADDVPAALHHLRRVSVIERVLVQQIDVLETMQPHDFLRFRTELAPASGFQSVQFREVEFLSGLKDPRYLQRLDLGDAERDRLQRRLDEPSVWDAFVALCRRRGADSVDDIVLDRERYGEVFELSESLLDHDANLLRWRSHHVEMVARQIGDKQGTGGSTGVGYLRRTLDKRLYPQLWQLRNRL